MKIAPLLAAACSLLIISARADDLPPGYVPLSKAVTTAIRPAPAKSEGLTGYLGAAFEARNGGVLVSAISANSPAEKSGLQKGDLVASLGGKALKTTDDVRDLIQSHAPGDSIPIKVTRGGETKSFTVALDAVSRPRILGDRAILGLRTAAASDRAGLEIASITPDKPAAKAGLRLGDRIMSVDREEVGEAKSVADVLLEKKPGDIVSVSYVRNNAVFKKDIKLEADDSDGGAPGEEKRILTNIWKKPVFRLAIIGIDFSDTRHNDAIPAKEWEDAFFSRGVYNNKNATGQKVYGSMADYYHEASCGRLKIEGKAFGWIEASKKKPEYNVSNKSKAKTDFFTEIVSQVEKKHGADALKDYDGIGFIYAGTKASDVQRSSILWPHRASVKIGQKNWPYVIVPESSGKYKDGMHMSNISTMCHECGHILGLPDLYARPENPGSEGAGVWSVMSNQMRNGQPQHFCAWSKEQLGWLTPVVIDPSVKQKIVLGPVEGSTTECAKILVRPDGSEYFLLENRRKTGFDAGLPAEGLLIWRVVANRPILEESHGVEGPAGPRVFLNTVPWPSQHNHSFTPYTTPSSRSQMGGGNPVWITNIRQLKDGRVSFEVGYEYE